MPGMFGGRGSGSVPKTKGAPGFRHFMTTRFGGTVGSSSPCIVTTDVGSLDATGFAPSVAVTNNQQVTPDVGSLIATGLAPSPSVGVRVATDVGSLITAGFAPTAAASDNQAAVPGVGAVVASGFAPVVVASDNTAVLPGVGAVVAAGLAPAVAVGATVATDTGQVDAIAYAPDVAALAPQVVTPDVGQAIATGYAPSVEVGGVVTPPAVEPIISFGPVTRAARRRASTYSSTHVEHEGIAGRQSEAWRTRMLRLLDDALEAPDEKGLPAKKRKAKGAEHESPLTVHESPLTATRHAIEGLAAFVAPAPSARVEPRAEPPAPTPQPTQKRAAAHGRARATTIEVIPPPEPVRVGAAPVVAGIRFTAVRLGRVGAVAGARAPVHGSRTVASVAATVDAHAIENPSDEELLMLLGV